MPQPKEGAGLLGGPTLAPLASCSPSLFEPQYTEGHENLGGEFLPCNLRSESIRAVPSTGLSGLFQPPTMKGKKTKSLQETAPG